MLHHGRLLAFDEPEAVMQNQGQVRLRRGAVVTALAVRDLHVYLGESHVLQGISFTVPDGRASGVMGRNGVGQDDDAPGAARPRRRAPAGTVTLSRTRRRGRRCRRTRSSATASAASRRRGVRRVDGEREPPPRASRAHPDYELVYDLFPVLRERGGRRRGTLSGGEQQMVAIARALLDRNALLLVDRPTKGLSSAHASRSRSRPRNSVSPR